MYFFSSKQDCRGIETVKPLCAILANLSVHFLCYVIYLFGYLFMYFYISLSFFFIGKYILTYLLVTSFGACLFLLFTPSWVYLLFSSVVLHIIFVVIFVVACTLCPSQITAQSNALEVWKSCLHDGYCITMFRDEVLYIHKEIQILFESMKGYVVILCLYKALISLYKVITCLYKVKVVYIS